MVTAPDESAINPPPPEIVSAGGHTCIDRYVDGHIFFSLKRMYL